MISFDSVSFQYSNKETSFVLREVSFTLKKGLICGIIGSNGSGKSTAAKLCAGLLKPTEGKITVDGWDLSQKDKTEGFPRYISGLIFQNPDNQIVGTTVEEDLAFGLENLGFSPDEMKSRVLEVSQDFGINELLNRTTSSLSGGQKQILCIAGIMVMRPSWVIFDEPTSHLDPWSRKSFWKLIKHFSEKFNTGVVVISQLPDDIYEFDHITILKKGRLLFSDAAENYEIPNFKDLL